MFFSKLSAFTAVAVLSAAPSVLASRHMILPGGMIAYTREDPIVNPGAVSSHVHAISGASNFNANSNYQSLREAKCTTLPIQELDKSAYWTSGVYYQDQNTKKLTLMENGRNHYYFFDRAGKNEKVTAFPEGFRMLAGNPNRYTFNSSSEADQAVSFVCLDYSGAVSNDPAYAQRNDLRFPDINKCKNGIRMQIFMPSCWDGKNLDSPDHKSHMSYPIGSFDNGVCPPEFPVHLVSIFFETFIDVANHPYWGEGAYVTSTGDPIGYSWHADFMNGWDVAKLQEAIDTCPDMNGNAGLCPLLAPYIDSNKASACKLELGTPIVDEVIGVNGEQLDSLPGCNAIRAAGVAPSTAACTKPVPGFVSAQAPLPSGWGYSGCITEGTNGRALTGASTKSANMTVASCAAFCQSKGFSIAGAEYGDECYCGNSFTNGASGADVGTQMCSVACAGNSAFENCGGPSKLTIVKAGAGSSVAASSTLATSSVASATSQVAVVSPSSSKLASSSVVATSSVKTTSASSSAAASSSTKVATSSSSIASSSSASTPSSTPVTSAPSGWTAAGCVTDSGHRALTGFSTTASDMTIEKCTSTCSSKGFSMAGLEYGSECYCGNSFANGLGAPSTQCNFKCGGASGQTCGGNWALSLYKTSSAPSSPSGSAPATWSQLGCFQDGPARALTGFSTSSSSMTVELCTSTCASKGFTKAGIEYGSECYCGNSFANGLGKQLDAKTACYMSASGNHSQSGGGTWTLNVFQSSASPSTKRSTKRSKHFGRVNNYHHSQF